MSAPQITYRKAEEKDVHKIHNLIEIYVQKSVLLERSDEEVRKDLEDFWVADMDGEIIGCAALYKYLSTLAEIRSVAVNPQYQRKGIGKHLITNCVEDARKQGIAEVFVLTFSQLFFEHLGFCVIDKNLLPHKIWKDCNKCPKKDNCQEIAMLRKLKT